jgi:hypothetical protein
MTGKERRQYAAAQRLNFRKVGDTRARHRDHAMRIPRHRFNVKQNKLKLRLPGSRNARVFDISHVLYDQLHRINRRFTRYEDHFCHPVKLARAQILFVDSYRKAYQSDNSLQDGL